MGSSRLEQQEREDSGIHPRNSKEELTQRADIDDHIRQTRLSLSDRLRRQVGRISQAFATLSTSGRLKRIQAEASDEQRLEDTREMVSMSLEAFIDGLVCVGALAESLRPKVDHQEGPNPYQLVADIIDHTARTVFEHPFFREHGVAPNDTILIEETPSSIDLLVESEAGYQSIRCEELFRIPETVMPHLDQVVVMWTHFLGKRYDISCFYELEIFEKLEDLKSRAKPMNRFFGGIIRAFDDAIDKARSRQTREEGWGPEETEGPYKRHGIPQPSFPIPPRQQVQSELEASEEHLLSMDDQFDTVTQEQIQDLLQIAQGKLQPQAISHQVADTLPDPEDSTEQLLNELYRELIPGSTLHLLNPRSFVLALLREYAQVDAHRGCWTPDRFMNTTIRQALQQASPGTRLLKRASKTLPKELIDEEERAEALIEEYRHFAEVAATVAFPKTSLHERIVCSELLLHDTLIKPEKPFSIHERVTNSPILQGAAPTREDKLTRLALGIIRTLVGKEGSTPGGIAGFFFLLTGNALEAKRWIKTAPDQGGVMQERARWLHSVFESEVTDPQIQLLMKAFFGFLHGKTKQDWDGHPGSRRGLFKLIRAQAKAQELDTEAVSAFMNAYDEPFQILDEKIGSLLDDVDGREKLDRLAYALRGYWFQSVKVSLPLLAGFLRADPRLRGRLRTVGKRAVIPYTLPHLQGPDCVSFFQGWQQHTGHMTLPLIEGDGTISMLGIKTRKPLQSQQRKRSI